MLSRPVADWLSQRGIHYGWLVIGVTFLTAISMAGVQGLPGALILPLNREFGWDNAEISSALALRLVLFGLMGPFAAALIERYGVRTMALSAVSVVAVGLALGAVMTQ